MFYYKLVLWIKRKPLPRAGEIYSSMKALNELNKCDLEYRCREKYKIGFRKTSNDVTYNLIKDIRETEKTHIEKMIRLEHFEYY